MTDRMIHGQKDRHVYRQSGGQQKDNQTSKNRKRHKNRERDTKRKKETQKQRENNLK